MESVAAAPEADAGEDLPIAFQSFVEEADELVSLVTSIVDSAAQQIHPPHFSRICEIVRAAALRVARRCITSTARAHLVEPCRGCGGI